MKIRPKTTKTPIREEDVDSLIANFGRTPAQKGEIIALGQGAIDKEKKSQGQITVRKGDKVIDDKKKSD